MPVDGNARQPPQDLEAEMSLLGALLLDGDAVGPVLEIIPREEAHRFYHPDHRRLYELLVDLFDAGQPVDAVVVRDELIRRNQLDQVGGIEYLVRLTESVPSSANCEHYARIVRDKGTLRDLIRCTGEVLEAAYEARQPLGDILDEAERRFFAVAEQRIRNKPKHLREFMKEVVAQIEAREGHVLTGVPSGFTRLDDLTSGFQKGELIIIAARPSMGKTALGLCMAEHMAADENIPAAFFSMEMGNLQIVERLLCSRGRIDSHHLRRGMLRAEQIQHLVLVAGDLSEKPLYVDDSPGLSVLELRAKVRRLKQMHDIRAVFVDYLQLMYDRRASRENRQQEISSISRGLKGLAREMNLPVIALAQLNRDPERREGNRPRMSDLRESGAIEQDADVVILLHRESYYQEKRANGDSVGEDEEAGKAELIVAKQRNGPTDTVELLFNKRFTRFDNLHPGFGVSGYEPVVTSNDAEVADSGVPF